MAESSSQTTITGLLQAAQTGDRQALDAVFSLVYKELTALAGQQRQKWHGDFTLNTTALVHEAYLKLAAQDRLPRNRDHFFAVAATAMRHILCDYARNRHRLKRGGDITEVTLDAHTDVPSTRAVLQLDLSSDQVESLAALDEAMQRLEKIAERQHRVVECRFFGGMSLDETARALDLSPATVKRDWTFARAWLRRELSGSVSFPE